MYMARATVHMALSKKKKTTNFVSSLSVTSGPVFQKYLIYLYSAIDVRGT